MYTRFYGLSTDPFRLSPDSDFCLLHDTFARAKAYMQFALHQGEGFAVVTGRPGTGKTTLIDSLLEDFSRSELDVARLVNARLEGMDLLRMVCYAFGIPADGADKSDLLLRLSEHMGRSLKQHKRPLLIIDEAQGLTHSALEELRLLTNLQIDGQPLLQIFLIGQDELQDLLAEPRLEQVRQRITAACRLEPLKPDETVAYVVHRLKRAGWDGIPRLKNGIFPPLYKYSGGVPRLINQACSRLLLHGCLEQIKELDEAAIDLVIGELRAEHISIPVTSPFIDLEDFDAETWQLVAEPDIPAGQIPEIAEELLSSLGPKECASPSPAALQPGGEETPSALQTQPVRLASLPAIKPSWRPEPGPGGGPERSVGSSPLWGLAASLFLALFVFGAALLSAPRHELRQLGPDDLWEHLGVEQIRGLVYRWTDGTWPLGGVSGAADRTPLSEPRPQPLAGKIAEVAPYPEAVAPELHPSVDASAEQASNTPVIPIHGSAVDTREEPAPSLEPEPVVRTPVSQIPFGFDSVEILPEHRKQLDTVASILIASRENIARIVGYTDDMGPSVYNDDLSARRAAAVAEYIRTKGVSGEQLKVEGRNGDRKISGDPAETETVRAVKIYFEPGRAFTHFISYDPE